MVFVPPLAVEKEEIEAFVSTIAQLSIQVVAFTSENRWMTIEKSLFCSWHLIPNFFIAHLLILVRYKTKGAVGAVCALLCI
jgi:hypothetical protein